MAEARPRRSTSPATTSSGSGRSMTSRPSGRRSGTSSRSRRASRTSTCSPRASCREPNGFPVRVSTTPSTCSGERRTQRRSRSSPSRRHANRSSSRSRELRDQVARARAGLLRLGRRAGRPRRGLPAEHPRDDRRVPRGGEHRRDLGDMPTGVRRAQRPPPARPALADGPAGGCRLPLRREARRPAHRGRCDARAAAFAAYRRPRPLPRRRGRLPAGRGSVECAARGARAARVRAGAVRPPALRSLLLGDDRPAEGDRPRPRRHPARAPQEPCAVVGHPPGRPSAVVHDDGMDDVERTRLDVARPRLDRVDRRQSDLPRPVGPVAARRAGSRRRCSASARAS